MLPSAAGPSGRKTAIGIQLFVVLAGAAYWAIWYLGDRASLANLSTDAYYAFQNAFPFADGWLMLCCLCGALALWRHKPSGLLWVLLAASCGIYLGMLDVTFNLENGVYTGSSGAALWTEVALNALSIGCGAWGIRFAWRNRQHFSRPESP
jgi:hypothetical protein